jgi:hypothetical protein
MFPIGSSRIHRNRQLSQRFSENRTLPAFQWIELKVRTTFRHYRWCILGIIAVIGCTPKSMIVGQMTELVDSGAVAFERDDDLDLVEKSLPANIKLLESLSVSSPGDIRLNTLLARLYGSYAFGFVETRLEGRRYGTPAAETRVLDDLRQQVSRYYARGADDALRALEKVAPGAGEALRRVDTVTPFLENLDQAAVAPLYWYGFNLGAWVNHHLDDVRAISRAHVARTIMERVIELEPSYDHGGAHLFLLAYFGSRPPMMGGDLNRAEAHYEQVERIAGDDYLLGELFYARFCLPQRQDRDGFVTAMQSIVKRSNSDSDLALYNAIAARRAAIYLSAVDAFFE